MPRLMAGDVGMPMYIIIGSISRDSSLRSE
jgi:hypothetical protein